jgi:exonuclease SbcC
MMNQEQRYLKTVRVRNFQSHRDTEVHFEPGINLIVGSSDVGKSALLRAINLAMHNEVPNREFVTFGAKNATVCLEFTDGTVVERVKGDDKNSYYLTLPDGETKQFDRVGTEVPEEVQRALGFPPSDKFHGPLAYADQHSKLFLVNLTPTELPRAISQLTGLDDFEEGAKALAKSARQFDRKIKDSAERVARMDEELTKYDGLDAQLRRLERYEQEMEALEELASSFEDAEELVKQYAEVMREGKAAKAALDAARGLAAMGDELETLQALVDSLDEAADAVEQYQDVLAQEKTAKDALAAAGAIATPEAAAELEELGKLMEDLEKMQEHLDEYGEVMSQGREAKRSLDAAKETLAVAEREEADFRAMLEEKGVLCKECGQVMDV